MHTSKHTSNDMYNIRQIPTPDKLTHQAKNVIRQLTEFPEVAEGVVLAEFRGLPALMHFVGEGSTYPSKFIASFTDALMTMAEEAGVALTVHTAWDDTSLDDTESVMTKRAVAVCIELRIADTGSEMAPYIQVSVASHKPVYTIVHRRQEPDNTVVLAIRKGPSGSESNEFVVRKLKEARKLLVPDQDTFFQAKVLELTPAQDGFILRLRYPNTVDKAQREPTVHLNRAA